MEGFSRAQLRAFSKRSAQIEKELEIKGAIYESPALRMVADDEASLATRTGKEVALEEVASERDQLIALLDDLDALGDHEQLHLAAECHHRADDALLRLAHVDA